MKPSRTLTPVSLALAIVLLASACGGDDTSIDATGGSTTVVVADGTTPDADSDGPSTDGPGTDGLNRGSVQTARARETWDRLGLTTYTYTYTQVCFCPPEATGPFRVVVVDGKVNRVESFGESVEVPARTIPEMYDAIDAAVNAEVEIDVTFDELTGHPVRVHLDLEAMAADGGDGIDITSFSSTQLMAADLAAARAQWAAAGITDYEMTYQLTCFCPEIIRTVTVRDGQVTGVVDEGEAFDEWPAYTVEDLFDQVSEAVTAPAFSLTVTYDEGYGFPSDFYIDVEQYMADEEHGVVVSSFNVLET